VTAGAVLLLPGRSRTATAVSVATGSWVASGRASAAAAGDATVSARPAAIVAVAAAVAMAARSSPMTGSSPVETVSPTRSPRGAAEWVSDTPVRGSDGSMIRPGTGPWSGSGPTGMAPAIDGLPNGPPWPPNRTVVRRSVAPMGAPPPISRRSAGPPRAGSGPAATYASSARVVARRGIASCATVTRISRRAGGRARISSTRAAPLTAPRMRPRARKLNSLAVTLPASRGRGSFASGAPSLGPA
jgi:hypothetical protein